ncbi:hypothetical protein ACP5PY_07175 [Photobacterium leiognathi subsp. mandapamensis]
MKKYITSDSKFNEIRMLVNKKKYKNKVFILLEGKTDIKLFRKLFDTEKVQLESLDGKDNVDSVVKAIVASHQERVIGIADADFDHISGIKDDSLIYLTDTHDTETLIINSVGIKSIIAEYATEGYHDGLCRNLHKNVFEIAYEIGLLKLVNCLYGYNLSFKEIDFNNFITVNGLNIKLDQDNFIDEVIHHSKAVGYDVRDKLINHINDIRSHEHCEYMVCSGHDSIFDYINGYESKRYFYSNSFEASRY